MPDKKLLKILDVLYDTAIERDSWRHVMEALAAPLDGVTGHLMTWDKNSGLIPHYEVFGIDDTAMESYASHWVLEDMRAPFLQAHPEIITYSDDMYINYQDLQQKAFFNEWEHRLTPQRYVVGHRVYQAENREILVSLGFDSDRGGIREKATELFTSLDSHFRRAVEIHQLFGRHLVDQTPELRILDNLNFGVVFLDELGRPGFYNRVAEQISERGDGLRLASNGLRAADGQSHSSLESIIRACRRNLAPGETPAGGWVSIARQDSGPDYAVLAIPMPEANDLHLFSNPRVLVLISDPGQGREDLGGALKNLYGLTNGEVHVCLSLAAGHDTKGIADELAVSRDAVRFHLKNIFSKTGVKRQGELIRLILSLPAPPRPVH